MRRHNAHVRVCAHTQPGTEPNPSAWWRRNSKPSNQRALGCWLWKHIYTRIHVHTHRINLEKHCPIKNHYFILCPMLHDYIFYITLHVCILPLGEGTIIEHVNLCVCVFVRVLPRLSNGRCFGLCEDSTFWQELLPYVQWHSWCKAQHIYAHTQGHIWNIIKSIWSMMQLVELAQHQYFITLSQFWCCTSPVFKMSQHTSRAS